MAEALELAFLGSVEVRRAGIPVAGLRPGKGLALLCYLAVTDRPHLRPTLAGLLWGEMPEAQAHNNLRKTLSQLRAMIGPHLAITRQSAAFDREVAHWLDVEVFEAAARRAAEGSAGIQRLGEAVDLYRGDFLEGFYIRQALAFEEWVLAQRARLRELALQALQTLAAYHAGRGEAGHAAGIDYTTRLLALEPWREEAHQQLMLLLARSGQRSAALAQYETCRELLGEELGVEPGEQTTRLYEQIRDGELEIPLVAPVVITPPEPVPHRPRFLEEDEAEVEPPVFVAREQELAWLDGVLEGALQGKGQVAFVTGGPGRGKTALLGEFARRAMDAHPELLLALGAGGAYAGVGDPYLPFREVLAMLSGEVEGRWASGVLTTEHARRIWEALPEVGAVLAERGSGLVGTLLPGRELLERARGAAPAGAGWVEELARLAGRDAPARGLEQSHIFEQVANMLLDLSARHPLLIVLDDLQWADLASVSLLFHLGRRLGRGRILLAGAYRPHELALGRDGQRHPLEPVLAELRTCFGDVWLDLTAADEVEGRRFVDQFLDTEPNRLAEGFRLALLRRTGGHALFTIELLRAMQGRGDLVRDEAGRWSEGERLAWEALPARAEAAIAERIARLPEKLRWLLAAASVEGEEFTAQVVARVQGMDELKVLRLLRRELAGRHRLVREQGEARVDGSSLSRYRFAHFLFQQHLYQGLGEGERRLLHRQVGEALEGLYEGHLAEVAVQLAQHFAGDPERERRYVKLAGERAAAQFANEEAVRRLTRALELTPGSQAGERYALLLTRERVYGQIGQRDTQRHDLAELQELAHLLGSERQAEVAVQQAEYYAWQICDYPQGVAAGQVAVQRAQEAGRVDLQAMGHFHWGGSLWRQGAEPTARSHFEEMLELARAHGLRVLEALALMRLGASASDLSQRLSRTEEALSVAQEIRDRQVEAWLLNNLCFFSLQAGDWGRARATGEQGLRLCREQGDLRNEGLLHANLAECYYNLGDYVRAQLHSKQSLQICREIEDRLGTAMILGLRAWVARRQGCGAEARCAGEQALRLARELGATEPEGLALHALGDLYRELGDHAASRECYRQALPIWSQLGSVGCRAFEALAGLACADLALGDTDQAQVRVGEVLAYLDGGGDLEATCHPSWVYLTCYRVLAAARDPRAAEVLERGHVQLQGWAASIGDEVLCRSYLENVAENRELVEEWQRLSSKEFRHRTGGPSQDRQS